MTDKEAKHRRGDPADELLRGLIGEELAAGRPVEPDAVAADGFQALFRHTVAVAMDAVVESLTDRLCLTLRRSPVLLVVGETGPERAFTLDRAEARATDRGLRVHRIHAVDDPFVFPANEEASAIFVDEALQAPALRDLLLSARRPVLLTADARDLFSYRDVFACAYLLPGRGPSSPPPQLGGAPLIPEIAAVYAVGEWGAPVPLGLVGKAFGVPIDDLRTFLESTGLFTFASDSDGAPVATALDARSLTQLLDSAGERRSRIELLTPILSATDSSDAATIIALLLRLAVSDRPDIGRSLARMLQSRIAAMLRPEVACVFGWARVLRRVGDLAAAGRVLDWGEQHFARNLDLERERASLIADRGALEEAARRLEALAGEHPNDVTLLDASAALETHRERFATARDLLDAALAIDPANAHLLVARGRALFRIDAADDAEDTFSRALDAAPGSGAILSAWARALAAEGRYHDAEERMRRAVRVEPWSLRHRIDIGDIHLACGNLEEASSAASAAHALRPGDPEAALLDARIFAAKRDWVAARQAVTLSLSGSESADGLAFLAAIEEESRTPHAALALLRRARALDPSHANARASWRRLAAAGGTIVTLERWSRGAPSSGAIPNALAAAPGEAPPTWALYRDERTSVTITKSAGGDVVASVEVDGRAFEGAEVTVIERLALGTEIERASGVSDEQGEIVLGPADALLPILSERAREGWQVRVVLPPRQA